MRKPPNETLGKSETTPARSPSLLREGRAPERTCILTRRTADKGELIRLALGPDGQVAPDIRARAPGRGAWIGVDRVTLDEAQARGKLRGALARAFKTGEISVPDDLADLATDELIARRRIEPRRRAENIRPEDKGGILAEYGLNEEQGNEIIMAARAHWFEDEGEDAVAETSQ